MDMITINPEVLKTELIYLFENVRVPHEDAKLVSDCLVQAEMMGVKSHGVQRVKLYIDSILQGGTTPKCEFTCEAEFPGGALYNANGALGIVAAHKAMNTAIAKASSIGIGIAGVHNSNHCGTMRYYTDMAAAKGMIGFATSNAACMMVPFGSREPFFGTNPISVSIPTKANPLVLDMATSVVARGKIILANKNGESIPTGWAVDKNGNPTTNAEEALNGYVLPFGGAKGSAIAMIADILCGVLLGGAYGPHVNYPYAHPEIPMDCGHLFIAIDVSKFQDYDRFLLAMEQYKNEVKELKPSEGFEEVYLPGELAINAKKRNKDNLTISKTVFEEIELLAEKLNSKFI